MSESETERVSSISCMISDITEELSFGNLLSSCLTQKTQPQVAIWELPSHEDVSELSDDDDLYMPNDTDTDEATLDMQEDIIIDLGTHPEVPKFNDILPHLNMGHIYDISGQESCGFQVQEQDHTQLGHLYHPWASENELWLSHFIFFKVKMTIKVADVVMRSIRNGPVQMDGLAATSVHQWLSIIDDGVKYVPVSSI